MTRGYTLIELLVVISIMSILSLIGIVNFRDFSSGQVATKAVGQIQSLLRLAQSNATSSTRCNNQGTASWSLVFSSSTIELRCQPTGDPLPPDVLLSITTLENAQIDSIKGTGCSGSINTLSYLTGVGTLTISPPPDSCLTYASSIVFTIKNMQDTSKTKQFTISKGGAINVE